MSRKSGRDDTGRTIPWTKTILGQPHSKANSRKLVVIKGKRRFIKSEEALGYLTAFAAQCPVLDPMFLRDVHVELEIFYTSRLPDLDESLILDALQMRVYRNDRQVRKKTVIWGLDPQRPRAVIRVSLVEGSDRAER